MTNTVAGRPQSLQQVRKGQEVRKPLNMRIRSETRGLPDMAAKLSGKNLTDFVSRAARQAAQNTLLDRLARAIGIRGIVVHAITECPGEPMTLVVTLQDIRTWIG